MKLKKVSLAWAIVLVLVWFRICFGIADFIQAKTTSEYGITATVFDVKSDGTVFIDESGNLWSVKDKGFVVGERAVLVMNDKGSSEFEDDVVRRILPAK